MDWTEQTEPTALTDRTRWGIVAFAVIAMLQIILVTLWWYQVFPTIYLWVNYGFVIEIGLLIGATEMISRYPDDPFAPLVSIPGALYILINGGAAALAYFLMHAMHVVPGEPVRTLTAGLGAMAFFRSGLFTVRVGGSDIAIGPNVVLQVILQALDRTYDRQRAVPRSQAVMSIMSGAAFSQVKDALPALCFDLMQNVSDAEISRINAQIAGLNGSSMSDDVKILSLGLALFNVVGEETLQAAVNALGSKIQGYQQVGAQMLIDLVKVLATTEPDKVVRLLPDVCAELPSPVKPRGAGTRPLPSFDVSLPELSPQGRAVLLLYKLVAYYGDQRVGVALGILANPSTSPPKGTKKPDDPAKSPDAPHQPEDPAQLPSDAPAKS